MLLYILIAIVSGLLGCFVLWNKMANYSDGASHAGVFGLAIASALNMNHAALVCLSILIFAGITYVLSRSHLQAYDTLIAVVSKGMASVGIILLTLHDGPLDHEIGEVFLGADHKIDNFTSMLILITSIAILLWVRHRHKQWTLVMIDPDLAKVEGVNALRVKLEIGLITTAYITLLMDVIGIIMVASVLVMPAATARYLSSNRKTMVVMSTMISILSVCLGYFISSKCNTPLGATTASVLFALFMSSGLTQLIRRH